jgi:hypothetical protein
MQCVAVADVLHKNFDKVRHDYRNALGVNFFSNHMVYR